MNLSPIKSNFGFGKWMGATPEAKEMLKQYAKYTAKYPNDRKYYAIKYMNLPGQKCLKDKGSILDWASSFKKDLAYHETITEAIDQL